MKTCTQPCHAELQCKPVSVNKSHILAVAFPRADSPPPRKSPPPSANKSPTVTKTRPRPPWPPSPSPPAQPSASPPPPRLLASAATSSPKVSPSPPKARPSPPSPSPPPPSPSPPSAPVAAAADYIVTSDISSVYVLTAQPSEVVAVHLVHLPGTDTYFYMERPSGYHPDGSHNIAGSYDIVSNIW